MSKTVNETELAFVWIGEPKDIETPSFLQDWECTKTTHRLHDSIYDTSNNKYENDKTGIRIRTKNTKTKFTLKKFIERGVDGEARYEERSIPLKSSKHPQTINGSSFEGLDPNDRLECQLQIFNERNIHSYVEGNNKIMLMNESVVYTDSSSNDSEYMLEVEFDGKEAVALAAKIKEYLLTNYKIEQIYNGKTERAKIKLAQKHTQPLIQNINDMTPQKMHAHGGKGKISMWFFHQAFSGFDETDELMAKVIGYEKTNWDFFAYAELPKGADVKLHKHNKTDEIYFIIDGSATITIDGTSEIIKKGDCILTRLGSEHSITKVTQKLKFIACEIYK